MATGAAPGPKQHFLPAAFIGRFSTETSGPRRQRRVWVRRRGEPEAFRVRAQDVGYEMDLYTLLDVDSDPALVDQTWSRVESQLPKALDELLASDLGYLDAHTWLETLVPFVTSLFVRGPEFNRRFESRLEEMFGEPSERVARNIDNTNVARLFELQRLYAVVIRAEWRVVHFPPDTPLLSTDVGYSLTRNTADDRTGYVVPLDLTTALSLIRGPDRPTLWWRNRTWIAGPIMHVSMPASQAETLNQTSARSAVEEIYGPTQDSVSVVPPPTTASEAVAVGPGYLVDPDIPLPSTEHLWAEMCGQIAGPPNTELLAREGDLVGAAALAGEGDDLDRAAQLLTENVAKAAGALGTDHPATRAAKRELAQLRRRQSDLAAVRAIQEDILGSAIRAEGEDSRDTIEARVNLGITLRDSGDLEKARDQQATALKAAEAVLGDRDISTALAAWGLFLTLFELKDESGRELMPRFMWLRDRDPRSLDISARDLRKELIRLFGKP